MWNRECLDLAILTAQIIGRNCFMEAVSMPRAWWHSPQRLSLRPAIPPTQNSKSRRGETEMAERTTLRKFAKECVSVSTHLIDRRPTARNPTPSLNLGLFSNFAVLYCFEQLDSWWNKKTDQGLSHIYHATCRPIMIHVVKELFPRFWYIAV